MAILAVFIHHAFHVKLLWIGVDLFFVLSGFLITRILLKMRRQEFRFYVRNFYVRRVRRIVPAYIVALLVSSLIFGFAWIHYWYFFIGGMNLLMPLGFGNLTPIPLWSLAVEEQFYLLWPLAVFFLNTSDLIKCAVTLIVLAPLLRFVCTPIFSSHWAIYMLLPFRMDTLAAGALIAITWPDIKQIVGRIQIAISGLLIIILSLALLLIMSQWGLTTDSNTPVGNMLVYEATLLIAVSAFVLALVDLGGAFLKHPILRFMGRISYSIYLIHLTFLYKIHSVLLATIATLIYATLMWFFVEEPILTWRSNKSAHRPEILGL